MSLPNAYVTLIYSASYIPGALVLAKSLKDQNSVAGKLVVLLPKKSSDLFTQHQLDLLSAAYDEVIDIDLLESKNVADDANLKLLLNRPELAKTFSKIQLYGLHSRFNKVLYLDADTLVLQNLDHLFDEEINDGEILASPDSGWPDIFNTGLFLVKPSSETHSQLVTSITEHATPSSFDGADQGLLNEYYQKFGTLNLKGVNSWKRLPFLYNVTPTGQYQYNPAFKRFHKDVKVLHYIGSSKPWATKVLHHDAAKGELFDGKSDAFTNLWWKTFYSHYGDNTDINSLLFPEGTAASEVPKTYDPSENFKTLHIDESTDAETSTTSPDPKGGILEHIFQGKVKAERHFGPDPF